MITFPHGEFKLKPKCCTKQLGFHGESNTTNRKLKELLCKQTNSLSLHLKSLKANLQCTQNSGQKNHLLTAQSSFVYEKCSQKAS